MRGGGERPFPFTCFSNEASCFMVNVEWKTLEELGKLDEQLGKLSEQLGKLGEHLCKY